MDITYLKANEIAKKCQHQQNLFCLVRHTYRDCDRPMCCGFCNTVDCCEDVCELIIGGHNEQSRDKQS
jgi:hypothetical protein